MDARCVADAGRFGAHGALLAYALGAAAMASGCERAAAPARVALAIDAPRPFAPAPGPAGTRSPVFAWQPPPAKVHHYELELDASCAPGTGASCSFASAERVTVADPTWQPSRALRGRHAWRVRACATSACSPWSRPRWVELGRVPADIDGDGRSETIAGAPLVDLGGVDRGAVLVLHGNGRTVRLDEPAAVNNAEFGVAITSADIDGDGFADLVVGAPGHGGGAGRAYFYRGPRLGVPEPAIGAATATSRTPSLVLDTDGRGDDWLGAAITTGDFDGDGFTDVAIAAPGADGVRPGDIDVGRVLLWRGGAAGVDPAPPRLLESPDPSPYDGFGSALSAGDLDGDGYVDLVVGAGGIDRAGRRRGTDRGAVYVYRGSADGLFASPTARLEAPVPLDFDRFGYAVSAAGDLDGDFRADVAVGAPSAEHRGSDSGVVYVFTGRAALAGAAPSAVLTVDAGEYRRFGSAVAGIGDVDGDGIGDLVVGTSGPDKGLALLYRGSREGIAATPWATLRDPNQHPGSDFGDSVGGAGDVNGDGHADLVVGAAGSRRGKQRGGSILVYPGASYGVAHPRLILGPDEQGHFGRTLAGR